MHYFRHLPVIVVLFLCGCSSIDGVYTPACMAYEGDEIELVDGRFTWRRFTDQRQVDEQGELVDPFPGYPKTGRYVYHDAQLDLKPDGGASLVSFYVQQNTQGMYMLTTDENRQFKDDGRMPECALRRAK